MNPFPELSNSILSLVKKKIKAGSLTQEKVDYLLSIQQEMLDALIVAFNTFDKSNLVTFMQKYFKIPSDPKNKNSVNYILPILIKSYTGRAAAAEKNKPFDAIADAAEILKKINTELKRNLDTFIPNQTITLFEGKISTVMLLGLLRETDLFINYTSYLWGHFVESVTKLQTIPIGYRAKYLQSNLKYYIKLINDITNKEYNYSFVQDINGIKKKNADLILYANNQTFSGFVDPRNYSGSSSRRLVKGIAVFNAISWLAERWDDYKHNKYLKNKNFKEWLENQSALLRLDLMNVQYDSPEYQRIAKIITLYNNKIAEYDQKIQEYENED